MCCRRETSHTYVPMQHLTFSGALAQHLFKYNCIGRPLIINYFYKQPLLMKYFIRYCKLMLTTQNMLVMKLPKLTPNMKMHVYHWIYLLWLFYLGRNWQIVEDLHRYLKIYSSFCCNGMLDYSFLLSFRNSWMRQIGYLHKITDETVFYIYFEITVILLIYSFLCLLL